MTKYIIYLSILFLIFSCKKKEKIEPIDDANNGGTISTIKYDISSFTVESSGTETAVLPNRLENTPDGGIIGLYQKPNLDKQILKYSSSDLSSYTMVYDNNSEIYDIKTSNTGVIYAVGEDGILTSTDNGNTWSSNRFTSSISWSDQAMEMYLQVKGNEILVCRNWGAHPTNDVFYSADGGVSFSLIYSANATDNVSAYFLSTGNYAVVVASSASSSNVYTSSNLSTWNSVLSGSWANYNAYYDSSINRFFVEMDYQAYFSDNLGATWTLTQSYFVPFIKMHNGDYVGKRVGDGLVRSDDGGISWVTLCPVSNGVNDVVEYQNNQMLAVNNAELYTLTYGNTFWNYTPAYKPPTSPVNYGGKTVYYNNKQLYTSDDGGNTWKLTISFPDNIAYATRMRTGKIYVVTKNSIGHFQVGYVLNTTGNYIEDTYNLPHTGLVTHHTSNGSYLAAIFKNTGNNRDYIAYTTDMQTWTALSLPNSFHKIHFMYSDLNLHLSIGYEDNSNTNFYKHAYGSFNTVLVSGNPIPSNYVNDGWPGYYVYSEFHRVVMTRDYGLAFFDNDLYVYAHSERKWYKSLNYQTFDAQQQAVLKNAIIDDDGYIVTSNGRYAVPLNFYSYTN